MSRRLFCELSPLTYRISWLKGCLVRKIKDLLFSKFARSKSKELLPYKVYSANSLIRRTLGKVDPVLQDNKAINLQLTTPKINGLLIKPNETFSFWNLVGLCSAGKGYKEGLVIQKGKLSSGIGGGMCQCTNLIHWLVLHTPLTITEHHHHDGLDLFPDQGRTVPFGTGTSIAYNYLDYRFKNTTSETYQLILFTTKDYLCGEIRSQQPPTMSYHVTIENEHFSKAEDGIYRKGQVYRTSVNKATGNIITKECIKVNNAKIMYDL